MSSQVKTDSAPSLDLRVRELVKIIDQMGMQLRSSLPADQYARLGEVGHGLVQAAKDSKALLKERQDLLALADTSQVINSSLDLNDVLRHVMDTLIRLTGAERGFLMLRNPNGELEIRIARNWEQVSVQESDFAISRTIVNRVAQDGQAVITTNAQEDSRFVGQESIVAHALRSILCVPLTLKDKITGVIYTDNRIRSGIFSEADRQLLVGFANQAAIAIENARLFQSVQATLAEVTELKNLMDNVFASIISGVITADMEDTIILVNEAAERILGQRKDQILGSKLYSVLPPIAEVLEGHVTSVRKRGLNIVGQEYNLSLVSRGQLDLSLNISRLKGAEETSQGVAIVLDDLTEKKKLEGSRKLLQRMVSPAVINQLDPNKLQLGGNRAEITTFFMDIRGFTRFSESMSAENLVGILNQYFTAAGNVILEQEGTIDKYMGDAIMAWFNHPIVQPDHAYRAVCAALKIRDVIVTLHLAFPPEQRLSFGVGINFGEALLGLVGTEARLDYTAIGDSVNTAKRIQENSAPNQIVISAPVYELVRDQVVVNELEPIQAKGKADRLIVYEVLGLSK